MKLIGLSQEDIAALELTLHFLEGRLEDPSIILWAAGLPSWRVAERQAVERLMFRVRAMKEPYRMAWAAVFEFWSRPEEDALQEWHLLDLDAPNARTGKDIKTITEAVRPFLSAEDPDRLAAFYSRPKRSGVKTVRDLLHISITSGDFVSPTSISLNKVDDVHFLVELAKRLDTALYAGLALHRRFMSEDGFDLPSYLVRRVYFVEGGEQDGSSDPDRHSRGFAASTKLLYAAVSRLGQLSHSIARGIADGWKGHDSGLYRRLWAAWARGENNVAADQVSEFFGGMPDEDFWDRDHAPEFAELRAVRWNSLPTDFRQKMESRLKKGPPVAIVPKGLDKIERADHRRRRSLAEFARITSAGGVLSDSAQSWVDGAAAKSGAPAMDGVTGDFPKGPVVVSVPMPDGARFGDMAVGKRQTALIQALLRSGDFDDDKHGASRFIGEHPEIAISLLAKAGTDREVAGAVWTAIGHYVRPQDLNATAANADQATKDRLPTIAALLKAIADLEPELAKSAIDPLASFMDSWDRLLGKSPAFLAAIRKLWPYAADAVNSGKRSAPLADLAYSTSIGRLTSALFQALPNVPNSSDFENPPWNDVLNELGSTAGEGRRQMTYRLLEHVGYFHHVSPKWTEDHLILPLRDAVGEDVELWGGFAQGSIPTTEIYDLIGSSLVVAVADTVIAEDARRRLAVVAVWSYVYGRADGGANLVLSPQTIQQMLRVGGPEVRAAAASALESFLAGRLDGKLDPGQAFETFRDTFSAIWPKERTLNAPKPAEVLAGIPATAPGRYAAIAEILMPYLVPFEAWSLHYYGVYVGSIGEKTITNVDTVADAEAFLAVLDATIGERESSVIPRGLDQALAHILSKTAKLEKDGRFQRLLTLSRR